MPVTLALTVDVHAPVTDTWHAAVDWEAQSAWMLGTEVRATRGGGRAVGGTLEAFTGLTVAGRRLGFLDPMRITAWDPPHRCDVVHTGRVVRGTGTFAVEERPGGSRFLWREDLDLPLGLLGRLGWLLVRPLFAAGLRVSLQRFAAQVEREVEPSRLAA